MPYNIIWYNLILPNLRVIAIHFYKFVKKVNILSFLNKYVLKHEYTLPSTSISLIFSVHEF